MDELRTIARPYAKAVFDVAAASSSLTEWSDFLKQCSSLLENNEIKALIKAPGLNKKKVAEVFYDSAILGLEVKNASQKHFLNLIQTQVQSSRQFIKRQPMFCRRLVEI